MAFGLMAKDLDRSLIIAIQVAGIVNETCKKIIFRVRKCACADNCGQWAYCGGYSQCPSHRGCDCHQERCRSQQMIANIRICAIVALCSVVPLAARGQSDDINIVVAKQSAKGLTDARWTTKLLKLQEESAFNSAISDGKQAFMRAGGASADWKPKVHHDSSFLFVNGQKFGVVKAALSMALSVGQTKSTIAFNAVRVMAIQGRDLVSVGCLRAADRPIPVADGPCAAAIRKTFGVGISQISGQ